MKCKEDETDKTQIADEKNHYDDSDRHTIENWITIWPRPNASSAAASSAISSMHQNVLLNEWMGMCRTKLCRAKWNFHFSNDCNLLLVWPYFFRLNKQSRLFPSLHFALSLFLTQTIVAFRLLSIFNIFSNKFVACYTIGSISNRNRRSGANKTWSNLFQQIVDRNLHKMFMKKIIFPENWDNTVQLDKSWGLRPEIS